MGAQLQPSISPQSSGWFSDARLGGVERFSNAVPDDWNMRIPNEILKCVCFLGVRLTGGENAGKFYALGTGFMVGVSEGGYDFGYLITARHVIDEMERGGFSEIVARFNKTDGTADFIKLPNTWIKFENPAIDIAVLAWGRDFQDFDIAVLRLDMIADSKTITDLGIGPGDDLFAVGLFTLKAGNQKNIPIVRSGILSAMPEQSEPFTKDGHEYFAYLAEMRSIGGLSGSPVFVYISRYRAIKAEMPEDADYAIFCLGLIRGHWDLQRDLSSDVVMEDAHLGFSKGENLNTGIAVVTPSHYILGILNHGKLKKQRQEFLDKEKAKR